MKTGKLESAEIARSCLQALQEYNGELNSFLSFDTKTILAQSRHIDSLRLKKQLLPGIPIAVKDLIDVRGQVTTSGSLFFRRAKHPEKFGPDVDCAWNWGPLSAGLIT